MVVSGYVYMFRRAGRVVLKISNAPEMHPDDIAWWCKQHEADNVEKISPGRKPRREVVYDSGEIRSEQG